MQERHWASTTGDSNGQPQSTSLPGEGCAAPSSGCLPQWEGNSSTVTLLRAALATHRAAACPDDTGYRTHDSRCQTQAWWKP